MLTIPCPEVSELLSLSGFDWLLIDMGWFSVSETQHTIQAIQGRCAAVVRVPENTPLWIKKALDLGCDGIVIPAIQTAEAARQAIAAAKYPPEGTRSVGIARAHGYGMHFAAYMHTANSQVAIILQIEHHEAIPHLDAMLQVPHLDGVLIGSCVPPEGFRSGSSGLVGDDLREIREACRHQEIPFGSFVMPAEEMKPAEGSSFLIGRL